VSPVYIDSSALVKLVLRETETDALREFLASAGPLTSSILATVEVARAVARVAPQSQAAMTAVMEALVVVAFDARIAVRAAGLAPAGLRTLDAIHLATALEFGDELTAFVCYDDRLSAAARNLGLPVVAPSGDV
jgi:predicted nucleic acid-binding protein